MNIDVVSDGLLLPQLERGTRLTLSPVGAYNLTQSMPFIHCRPAAVLIRHDGRVEVMRRAETIDDIEQGESLPADLALS
jgi:diaminopimelate decarboxylase